MCIFGVKSINITSLSREHAFFYNSRTVYMLYDDELYMLTSNKIYVMLCYVRFDFSSPKLRQGLCSLIVN